MTDGTGKIDNKAACGLASRACMQLALSLGTVLNSILVYLAPTQHFRALIALLQTGGAKVDIAAIRVLQEVPQSLPRTSIDARMRGIMLDWLMEVHMRYGVREETLYLAVKLIDRYIPQCEEQWSRLQDVGDVATAAMLIACKFNEVAQDEVRDEDIRQAELSVLRTLQFDIAAPLDLNFLNLPINCQKRSRPAKKESYPPPRRPHARKHLGRAGTLAQPGGRQRGKDRRAPRK